MANILNVHNAVASCSALIEFRGNASAVVLMNAYCIPSSLLRLRDVRLALARSQSDFGWASVTFTSLVSQVQLLATKTVQSDVNGFAHWICGAAEAISAGDSLRAEATVVG